MWCDEMVLLDHASTDATAKIVQDIDPGANRITVLEEDGEWDEMRHRQAILEAARIQGATHIAIIDADEILTANLIRNMFDGPACEFGKGAKPWIRTIIAATPEEAIMRLPLYNLRGSLGKYHLNGIWGNRWLSVAFQDNPRLSWSGDKFHSREPGGMGNLTAYNPIRQGEGGTMHLWGVNELRLSSKHALYKVTERIRYPHKSLREIEQTYNDWRSPQDNVKHWPEMPQWGNPWEYASVPQEWWKPYEHLMKYLDVGAYPWQIEETQRLVKEHGLERFELDLFGIA